MIVRQMCQRENSLTYICMCVYVCMCKYTCTYVLFMDTPVRDDTPRDCSVMKGRMADASCCEHHLQFTPCASQVCAVLIVNSFSSGAVDIVTFTSVSSGLMK